MLPDAFELERPHQRFSDAVLLGYVRQKELLIEPVTLRKAAIKIRGVASEEPQLRRLQETAV
jgi:hypothetical protein